MKFVILSLVTAGALALTADTASAQYRNYGSYNRGYSSFNRPYYGGYGTGWNGSNITIARPGFGITIGSGNVYPYYGGYGYARPYYGGYGSYYRPNYNYGYRGYRGYNGWRW